MSDAPRNRSESGRSRFALAWGLGLVLAGALSASAPAQPFITGFEAPALTGSPGGTIISGQDGWFLAPVADSIDGYVYTYAGNTLGIPANPAGGGDQFLGQLSQGGTSFARSQHEGMNFSGIMILTYDAAAGFTATPPTAQNLGSFSLQPEPNTLAPIIRTFILLNTWVDVNNPTAWNAGYLPYDAGGIQFAQPGTFPAPQWQNLELNHWYRFQTKIDLNINQIIEVSITDLNTGTIATIVPTGWYLGGGANSTLANPTGVRFFAGGGLGNTMAWDNLDVHQQPPPCRCDWNNDHVLNSQDFFDFLTDFFDTNADFNGDGATNSQDFFDFLTCFFTGCP